MIHLFRNSFAIALILIFSLQNLFSQYNYNRDSLDKIIKSSNDPIKKAETYIALADSYAPEFLEDARKCLIECRKIALEIDNPRLHSLSYSRMNYLYIYTGKPDSMVIVNKIALNIAKEHDLKPEIQIALSNLGTAYLQKENYEEAIKFFEESLNYPTDDDGRLITLNNMGATFEQLYDFHKALECYAEAIEIARRTGWQMPIPSIFANIAGIHRNLENYDEALVSFEKAFESINETKNEYGAARLYVQQGEVYHDIDSITLAMESFQKSLNLSIKFQDSITLVNALFNIAKQKREAGNLLDAKVDLESAEAILQKSSFIYPYFHIVTYLEFSTLCNQLKNFQKAIFYANKIFEQEAGSLKHHEAEALFQKAIAQKGMGLFEASSITFEEALLAEKKRMEEEKLKDFRETEAKFRLKEKDRDFKILKIQKNAEIKAEQSRRTLFTWLFIAVAILAIGLIYFLRKLQKQRNQLATQNKIIETQREELKTLDQFKSRFFANISHELRTSLTLMLSPIGSALKRNRLENQDFTFLKLAQQSGKNLLQLIDEILDLSKLESGKLELVEEPTVLYLLLRRLASSFESISENKNTQFQFKYQAEKELQILLDVDKFQKIVNNLLSNAFKFTNKGGVVHLSLNDEGNVLILQIADSGQGIHPEDLPHIFDRFYQSKNPEAAAQGGTGIGLALCREFSKIFNGKLWAESKLGEGSTFYFQFPKKEILQTLSTEAALELKKITSPKQVSIISANQEKALLPSTNNSKYEKTILVVEDNHSLRDYLQMILEEHYQIRTANNGAEAIERLATEDTEKAIPDLIITDIMMPIMNGYQLLEKLKATDDWRHIPVVMLTAKAELGDRLRALRIGVDDYLTKPFEEEELLTRVANLLNNVDERANWLKTFSPESENHSKPEQSRPLLSKEDAEWLQSLEDTVKNHISDTQLNVERLADLSFLSRRQLHRRIKQLTGLSPIQYLQEARLQEARHLLESRTVSSIKAVRAAVGVKDAKHFTQQFKKRFGKAPSEITIVPH